MSSNGSSDIEFGKVPRPVRKYDWYGIAEQLLANPGEWAKVFDEDNHGFSVSIRSGQNAALHPHHGFESKTRRNHYNDDGQRVCSLFVRYNPDLDTRTGQDKPKATRKRSNR